MKEEKTASFDDIDIDAYIQISEKKQKGKQWAANNAEKHIDDIYDFNYF